MPGELQSLYRLLALDEPVLAKNEPLLAKNEPLLAKNATNQCAT